MKKAKRLDTALLPFADFAQTVNELLSAISFALLELLRYNFVLDRRTDQRLTVVDRNFSVFLF